MVKFISPWEVVNGMFSARQRGHGCVSTYLRGVGVPRSTAYRWDKELRWLAGPGRAELRRLRAENKELSSALASLGPAIASGAVLSREQERAFILEAVVAGNSDPEIARLLERAGGRSLSEETIRATIVAAAREARVAYERYFAGVGTVCAADEIFLGQAPLLLAVEPLSLLISALRLAPGCSASDWEPVFAGMPDLSDCGCDGGKGVNRAVRDAGAELHRDLFHGLRQAQASLGRLEQTYAKRLVVEQKALSKLEEAQRASGKYQTTGPTREYHRAQAESERVLAEWCRLGDLFGQVRRAFDLVGPDGKLHTAAEAQASVAAALAAMTESEEGRSLASKLAVLEQPAFFAHLSVLEERLGALGLEQVGPGRQEELARQVAETVAWRRRDKTAVSVLRQASTGSLADEVELAVIEAVDHAIRSSSAVECVNARVRLVQVARKRLGEDMIYLLAVYHNVHTFGRGSVRAGQSPAELAGIELPTSDWIELLDLAGREGSAAGTVEEALAGPEQTSASAESAA
jgi:hypothetical protein